jgi:uncharacterized protein
MKFSTALYPILMFLVFPAMSSSQDHGGYRIAGVPFSSVALDDAFWSPRLEVNRTVTIPTSFARCAETGRVQNFVNAATKSGTFLTRFPFDDTDIYKTLEGAAYSLVVHPDPGLDRYCDSLIAIVRAAQEPDGYLYTARTINPGSPHEWSGKERWVLESKLSHELYNSGHLFEAAAAHYTATGKRNLLDIALKNADLLSEVFGPGRRTDAPGHEIVEMGLIRLYRVTGERKYLDLAKFFIDCRGAKPDSTRTYWQDHKPVVMQDEAVGHAVRAGYLYSGVADVAALTRNEGYIAAIDRIWSNMAGKKYYITGGIGAVGDGERFGGNYELPNLTAYNETCAAIANVYWNYRMFLLHGTADYIDVLERSLYNAVAAGVALDGRSFFYDNPLECVVHTPPGDHPMTRQSWFECSCCPTNICRFLPSIPGYVYARKEDSIYVNLFMGSRATIDLGNNRTLVITQTTRYPWDGTISLTVDPAAPETFTLLLRIPGWARNTPAPGGLYSYLANDGRKFSIALNGKAADVTTSNGYACLTRVWRKGDRVDYVLPMSVHRVIADERVKSDSGQASLERGPIVFCLEGRDNGGDLRGIVLPDTASISATFDPELLNGVEVLKCTGLRRILASAGTSITTQPIILTAVPYDVWNNRGPNDMKVWLPRSLQGSVLPPKN